MADRDGIKYLEADPSEENWPGNVQTETGGERLVPEQPFPLYVIKLNDDVEDTRGVVEVTELFNPVDHTYMLKTVNIILC